MLDHPAIIFGLSPTGLSVARSLAPRGVTVYGVDVVGYEIAHYSRWLHHDRRISRLGPTSDSLDSLIAFGKDCPEKPVIFITSDAYIDFIAEHREALAPYYVLTESMRPEINSVFVNKRTFYEMCQQLGTSMPATYFPTCKSDVKEAAKDIRYPAILKPSYGHKLRRLMHGNKLVEVNNIEELLHWWDIFQEWQAEVVLQECIVGPERNIAVGGLYMNHAGECLSIFTATKYRQHPPLYGSGSYMEANWKPDIAKLSIDLMQQLKYHGVCGTEYKWDERDKKWKLIEVNVRPTLWFALTRAAGVDVVWDAYCDMIGKPNPPNMGKQNDTIRWQFLARDIASSGHFLRNGELSWREFMRTTLSPVKKEEAILAWNDWGANFGYFAYVAGQIHAKFLSPAKKG